MPISFQCECGRGFTVDDQYAGGSARCQTCGRVVVIPGPVSAPAYGGQAVAAAAPARRTKRIVVGVAVGALAACVAAIMLAVVTSDSFHFMPRWSAVDVVDSGVKTRRGARVSTAGLYLGQYVYTYDHIKTVEKGEFTNERSSVTVTIFEDAGKTYMQLPEADKGPIELTRNGPMIEFSNQHGKSVGLLSDGVVEGETHGPFYDEPVTGDTSAKWIWRFELVPAD